MSLTVEGTAKLRHKLRLMRTEQREQLSDFVEQSLTTIENEARALAPEEEGDLKASMFHEKFANQISGRAGSQGTPHARHVHFGRKATATNRGTAPVPYLFVPFEIERKKLMRRVRKAGRALYRRMGRL